MLLPECVDSIALIDYVAFNLFITHCLRPFSGTDQSQAQLLGPDCQILGFAGMFSEDSPCGEEDFGFI